jgi:predicted alpha-1,6-mannanase (GH76 family)
MAFDALVSSYWNEAEGLFEIRIPAAPVGYDLPSDPFHYWWQAHALDSLVDAFQRDSNAQHLERAAKLLEGIQKKNGSLTNDYYDDMEWLALACLRAWDASQLEAFKRAALALWTDIQGGWNDACGGGIAWRKSQMEYKNTPANAPAAILAARLHTRFHASSDLAWGQKIYDWLETHLIDPETGFVWDGMNREGDGKIDKTWAFTYCQGVTVGAALELYTITGKDRYLTAARRTSSAARSQLSNPATHAMPDEGGGDAGLFKGILSRYLGNFVQTTNDSEARHWLEENAELAWQHRDAETGLSGTSWTNAPTFPLDLSSALSGVMILEAMAGLERSLDVAPLEGKVL